MLLNQDKVSILGGNISQVLFCKFMDQAKELANNKDKNIFPKQTKQDASITFQLQLLVKLFEQFSGTWKKIVHQT